MAPVRRSTHELNAQQRQPEVGESAQEAVQFCLVTDSADEGGVPVDVLVRHALEGAGDRHPDRALHDDAVVRGGTSSECPKPVGLRSQC